MGLDCAPYGSNVNVPLGQQKQRLKVRRDRIWLVACLRRPCTILVHPLAREPNRRASSA